MKTSSLFRTLAATFIIVFNLIFSNILNAQEAQMQPTFPNPATGNSITVPISFSKGNDTSGYAYDLGINNVLGQEMVERKPLPFLKEGNTTVELDIRSLLSGRYFITLASNGSVIQIRKIIISH